MRTLLLPNVTAKTVELYGEMCIANEFMSKLLYTDAGLLYKQIYRLSEDLEALYGMCLCAYYNDQKQTALSLAQELLEKGVDNSKYLNLAGLCAARYGYLRKAENIFKASQACTPSDVEAQRSYGELLLKQGEYRKGLELILEISRKYPNDIPTLLMLAKLNHNVGRDTVAQKYIDNVFKLDPNNVQAHQVERMFQKGNTRFMA